MSNWSQRMIVLFVLTYIIVYFVKYCHLFNIEYQKRIFCVKIWTKYIDPILKISNQYCHLLTLKLFLTNYYHLVHIWKTRIISKRDSLFPKEKWSHSCISKEYKYLPGKVSEFSRLYYSCNLTILKSSLLILKRYFSIIIAH